MADKREIILDRLGVVLDALNGITFKRNDLAVDESELPVIIQLDGDEEVYGPAEAYGRGRPATAPQIMQMYPQVYFVLDGQPEDLGTLVTRMRARIAKAVLSDPTLRSLVTDDDIRYEGMESDLALGRSITGQAGLQFSMLYLFNPNDLNVVDLMGTTHGGGELSGSLQVGHRLSGLIDGGGVIDGGINPAATLSGLIDGGGTVRGHIFPPIRLTATIEGGGQLTGDLYQVVVLSGSIDGGGHVGGDLTQWHQRLLAGLIDGGGLAGASMSIGTPRFLSGLVDGAGLIDGNITIGEPPDADTLAIAAAMDSYPDEDEIDRINTVVTSLKTANVWSKLDGLYLFKRTEQAALINWINPAQDGTNNGCTFGATTGFTRTAGAQFVGVPFPSAGNYSQNSAAAGVLYDEVGATTNRIMSTNRTAGAFLTVTVRAGPADMQGALNDTTADTRTRSTGSGLYSVVRTASDNKALYKGGIQQGVAFTTPSTGVPVATTLKVFDGALGSSGVARGAFIGGKLTSGELTALESAMNAFFGP